MEIKTHQKVVDSAKYWYYIALSPARWKKSVYFLTKLLKVLLTLTSNSDLFQSIKSLNGFGIQTKQEICKFLAHFIQFYPFFYFSKIFSTIFKNIKLYMLRKTFIWYNKTTLFLFSYLFLDDVKRGEWRWRLCGLADMWCNIRRVILFSH